MRMKDAMAQQSNQAVTGMFDDAMRKLLSGIEALVKRLKQMIASTSDVISKSMNTVFSICWDDQQAEALIDPEMQKRMRECRDKLLPKLNELVEIQNGACEMLGIEREDVELDGEYLVFVIVCTNSIIILMHVLNSNFCNICIQ